MNKRITLSDKEKHSINYALSILRKYSKRNLEDISHDVCSKTYLSLLENDKKLAKTDIYLELLLKYDLRFNFEFDYSYFYKQCEKIYFAVLYLQGDGLQLAIKTKQFYSSYNDIYSILIVRLLDFITVYLKNNKSSSVLELPIYFNFLELMNTNLLYVIQHIYVKNGYYYEETDKYIDIVDKINLSTSESLLLYSDSSNYIKYMKLNHEDYKRLLLNIVNLLIKNKCKKRLVEKINAYLLFLHNNVDCSLYEVMDTIVNYINDCDVFDKELKSAIYGQMAIIYFLNNQYVTSYNLGILSLQLDSNPKRKILNILVNTISHCMNEDKYPICFFFNSDNPDCMVDELYILQKKIFNKNIFLIEEQFDKILHFSDKMQSNSLLWKIFLIEANLFSKEYKIYYFNKRIKRIISER